MELVPEKKSKATVGRICKTEGFKYGMRVKGVMDDKSGESMEPIGEVREVPLGKSE